MSSPQSDAAHKQPSRRNRRRNDWLIVTAVMLVFAVALATAAWDLFSETSQPSVDTEPLTVQDQSPAAPAPEAAPEKTAASNLIEDDGATLWVSPTNGPPLDPAYLPPGTQVILALRPNALLNHPEGEKVVAALGPVGAEAVAWVEQAAGLPLRDIERILIGWQISSEGDWKPALVISSTAPFSYIAPANAESHQRANAHYFVVDNWAYYQPVNESSHKLVVAAPTVMQEILELGGSAPPLRRDMERLLPSTDAYRHVTVIFAPNLLSSAGRDTFTGELAQLRRPISWFLGDGPSAAVLSMHWDQDFFIEVVAIPTLDVSPDQLSTDLAKRIAELPQIVEDFVVDLSLGTYGRRVVARLPEMVRKLADYTRCGVENDRATLRCYLPSIAGHNILMGAELALAEGWAGTTRFAPTAEAAAPASVSERLKKRTSLRFTRDTLEAALTLLSQDIGVQIVIRGPDLQSEGITKNQSFGIDLSDQPADKILVEILRLANPDKLATGPSDSRQKLVYVIGPDSISITTRAKAMERGDTLPPAFLPGS